MEESGNEGSRCASVRPALADRGATHPHAGHGQVLVKMETCGVCHTDIHAAHGDWPVKPHPPFVPGHEGVGIVTALGQGCADVTEGDRVAIPWLGYACGACEYCASGRETLCPNQQDSGYTVDGAYAEYAVAEAAFVGQVPGAVDPLDAAPLTCAGVTTYKAVKVAGTRSSDLVAVFGIGGLGHLAVQYARIAGASVAAVDLVDSKLAPGQGSRRRAHGERAHRRPGRSHPGPRRRRPGHRAGGVPSACEQAFKSLKRGGTLVFVALPADNFVQIPIFETVLGGITVTGSIVGTRVDLAETFQLHAEGRTRVVRESRQLEEVNDAFEQIEKGAVDARLVFDFRQ